jgi:hypothetical protein
MCGRELSRRLRRVTQAEARAVQRVRPSVARAQALLRAALQGSA